MESNSIQFTPNQLPEIKPISNPNTFKYLFILFFVLFLITLGVLITIISDKNKIPDSQSDEQVLPTQTISSQPTNPADPRDSLTMEEWNDKFIEEFTNKGTTSDEFYQLHFSAKPNTTVPYISSGYGYSIDLPYNPSWGDSENNLKPYEKSISNAYGQISFGQPYGTEGGGSARASMGELPPSTIDQTISEINQVNTKINIETNNNPIDGISTYKVITGLRFPVLQIDTSHALFGLWHSYKVFLPKVTLEFSDPFSVDLDLVTQLINSIKFL